MGWASSNLRLLRNVMLVVTVYSIAQPAILRLKTESRSGGKTANFACAVSTLVHRPQLNAANHAASGGITCAASKLNYATAGMVLSCRIFMFNSCCIGLGGSWMAVFINHATNGIIRKGTMISKQADYEVYYNSPMEVSENWFLTKILFLLK